MDFIFFGGGEDLITYTEVNKPSIGIVQKKPEFSNIKNGLGIFSSRYITTCSGITIENEFKTNLSLSETLSELNFVTP